PVTISLNSTTDEAVIEVSIEISGVGKAVGRVKRPAYSGAGLTVGDPSGLARDIHLDDLRITSLSGKDKVLLAAYDFEEPSASPAVGELAVFRTLDHSGKNHDLVANVSRQSTIQYVSTSGIDPTMAKQLESNLID